MADSFEDRVAQTMGALLEALMGEQMFSRGFHQVVQHNGDIHQAYSALALDLITLLADRKLLSADGRQPILDEISPESEKTPLTAAIARDNRPMVRFLVQRGAGLDVPDGEGLTPLIAALDLANQGDEARAVKMLEALLADLDPPEEPEEGQVPPVVYPDPEAAIIAAIYRGLPKVLETLVDFFPDHEAFAAQKETEWEIKRRQPQLFTTDPAEA